MGDGYSLGVVSDVMDAGKAWGDGAIGLDDITAPVGAVMSGVDTFVDPLGALIKIGVKAAIKFILDHCHAIRAAIDGLLGDPDEIKKIQEEWDKIGADLAKAQETHAGYKSDLPSWHGPAADGYRGVGEAANDLFTQAGHASMAMGKWVQAVGTIIEAVRDFVIGIFEELITQLVEWGVIALAGSVATLGTALAAYTAWAGGKIAWVGKRVAGKLLELVEKVAAFAEKLGISRKQFDKVIASLKKANSKFSEIGEKSAKGDYKIRFDNGDKELPGEQLAKDYGKARDAIKNPLDDHAEKGDGGAFAADPQEYKGKHRAPEGGAHRAPANPNPFAQTWDKTVDNAKDLPKDTAKDVGKDFAKGVGEDVWDSIIGPDDKGYHPVDY